MPDSATDIYVVRRLKVKWVAFFIFWKFWVRILQGMWTSFCGFILDCSRPEPWCYLQLCHGCF